MRFFTITARSNFISHSELGSGYHIVVFQGIIPAQSKHKTHWANEPPGEPLPLIRSGDIVPSVTMPGSQMVVTESLTSMFSKLPNVAIRKPNIVKAVDAPFRLGDKSFYSRHPGADPEQYLTNRPDNQEMRARIGQLYEVAVWRLQNIPVGGTGTKSIKIDSGTPPIAAR
jgi:hypothetical protein